MIDEPRPYEDFQVGDRVTMPDGTVRTISAVLPTTLVEFLLARIQEDADDAIAADGRGDQWCWGTGSARVLAECEAKRRIIELHAGTHECAGEKDGTRACVYVAPGYTHELDPTLLLLALPYADHPEYDEEWP